MRGISGEKRNTPLSDGQELKKAQSVVEKIMSDGKNRKLIDYILFFANERLKINGGNLSIAQLKKISDEAMVKLKIPKIPREINMHILNLSIEGVKKVIERLQFLEKEEINNAV
jgi:hypothetical protein